MKKRKPTTPPKPEFPWTVETYMRPSAYRITQSDEKPDCFNGIVSVRRYRVTAEIIDEPKEVIAARLLKLWRECDNHHHFSPLRNAAAQIGIELPHDQLGKDRP